MIRHSYYEGAEESCSWLLVLARIKMHCKCHCRSIKNIRMQEILFFLKDYTGLLVLDGFSCNN
jgi:hypothetical protein